MDAWGNVALEEYPFSACCGIWFSLVPGCERYFNNKEGLKHPWNTSTTGMFIARIFLISALYEEVKVN